MAFHRVVISDVLSRELESCRQWLVANKLSLHFGKTGTILFESQHKLSRVNKFEVYCDDKIINPNNSVKYLGITLDENLKGESISKSIVKKTVVDLGFFLLFFFNADKGIF